MSSARTTRRCGTSSRWARLPTSSAMRRVAAQQPRAEAFVDERLNQRGRAQGVVGWRPVAQSYPPTGSKFVVKPKMSRDHRRSFVRRCATAGRDPHELLLAAGNGDDVGRCLGFVFDGDARDVERRQ
jgi:hypothetical protein